MTKAKAVAVKIEELDADDIEETIFAHRLTGRSSRWISKRFGIPCREVEAICAKLLPTFNQEERFQEAQLEVARMDALYTKHFPTAMKGDLAATAIVIRLSERKSELLGLTRAPERTAAPSLPMIEVQRETSTAKIAAALDRLCAEGLVPPQIEGEILQNPEQPSDPSVH